MLNEQLSLGVIENTTRQKESNDSVLFYPFLLGATMITSLMFVVR